MRHPVRQWDVDVPVTQEYLDRQAALAEQDDPVPRAPNGMAITEITLDPVTDALDQAALEQAADEEDFVVPNFWTTTAFKTALLWLAGGYGVAWFARKQRWV